MSRATVTSTNEQPRSPSTFSSLPNDIVLNILAGVPRRNHPILSCVSKNFRSLIRSSLLHETRSLMGKASLYVCLKERDAPSLTCHWFTLTDKRLVPTSFPSQPEPCSASVMVGPEIYFVSGYYNHRSSNMWILDTRSGKLRQGPTMLVARSFTAVGLVDQKIYVFGGDEDERIQAEVFDTRTRTWEVAPSPCLKMANIWMSVTNPSLDRKVYVRKKEQVIVYDPRDGQCEKIYITKDMNCSTHVCVIDNVLYIYHSCLGLMWYDYNQKDWRVVKGLKHEGFCSYYVKMAEHNGKLLLLNVKAPYLCRKNEREIWCAMITLNRSGVEVMGKVEWFDCILSVPYNVDILHCLGRTD